VDLTPQDIFDFMKMWYEAFGEVLTYAQAEAEAKRLVAFFFELSREQKGEKR